MENSAALFIDHPPPITAIVVNYNAGAFFLGCVESLLACDVLLSPEIDRQKVLDEFKRNEIWSFFHYVPLHSSPAGMRYGRTHGSLDVTNRLSERLVRLPLWVGLPEEQQQRIVEVLYNELTGSK